MPHVLDVDLGPGVAAWFTGRAAGPEPAVGRAGNLSSRRPHQPGRLAADRRSAFARHGLDPAEVHLMRQVHGDHVEHVDAATPRGRVLPDTDAAVTTVTGRALAVLTADCLPVLVAGPRVVAAAHAGRRGLLAGVLEATVDACARAGDEPAVLRAVIGPAIGPCCYEVPADMRDAVAATDPPAAATTTWGTPSLDLVRAARDRLERCGVSVETVGTCTCCDSDRWFSHRADPDAGRQAGVVVRLPGEVAA